MKIEQLKQKIIELSKEYYRAAFSYGDEKSYIPASGKVLGEEELCNMIEASLDMWLTTGRFNDEFEKRFAEYLGVKYALTTNSGSSANLLALSALTSHKLGKKALKPGDEVITVAAGFPTTVNPIIQNGLIPVFVDVELGNYNASAENIEAAVRTETRAVFLAHTLGSVYDLDSIIEICRKYDLWLIEDSCDALGAKYKDKFAGTVGHIGTYSFYPAHHMTMGEGGAVVTNSAELYRIIMSFRDWGRDCWCKPGVDNTCKNRFSMQCGNLPFGYDHKYTYSHIGYNLKITDWQAAIGVAQLNKLDGFLKKRNKNAQFLLDSLTPLEEFLLLPEIPKDTSPSWFGFLISVKDGAPFSKQNLVEFLEANGVGTRQLFAGNILRQPMFVDNDIALRIANSQLLSSNRLTEEHYAMLPNSEFIMNNSFWVGCFQGLGENELKKTAGLIYEFVKGKI